MTAGRAIVASVGLVAILLSGGAAHADGVKVKFGLQTPKHTFCSVSVPKGSNAVAVLEAGKRKHCITGYRLNYRYRYVVCIDGVCGRWSQFDNSRPEYSVDDFRANAGDRLVYSYVACVFTPNSFFCV